MNADLSQALAHGLDVEPTPIAAEMAESLAAAFGPSAIAVIHYGSKARGIDARGDSAYDFFVIVDDYRSAYESLEQAMPIGRTIRTATTLARILPPSVHALPPVPDGRRRNKCGVLSLAELRRAARLQSLDHFVVGRLFQHVQLIWARDEEADQAVRGALVEIRARTFEWGRCYLPETFDAEVYCRTLLETSFAGEIRPEGGERASDLFEAQRSILVPVYEELLQSLEGEGVLERVGSEYRQREEPTPAMRRRWKRYFRISKTRATTRWGKAVVLYDGWLDYIVQKITRHNQVDVELTERERRWPFIFLWPKVFLFFRERANWESRR